MSRHPEHLAHDVINDFDNNVIRMCALVDNGWIIPLLETPSNRNRHRASMNASVASNILFWSSESATQERIERLNWDERQRLSVKPLRLYLEVPTTTRSSSFFALHDELRWEIRDCNLSQQSHECLHVRRPRAWNRSSKRERLQ